MAAGNGPPGFPQHEGIVALREAQEIYRPGYVLGSPETTTKKRDGLFEAYGGRLDVIYADSRQRPDHYTEHQRALLHSGMSGRKLSRRDLDDLFITSQRPTTSKSREIIRRITAPTIPEIDAGGNFENQELGDRIII